MSITEFNKVDFVSHDKATHTITMIISDHLDWQDKKMHLRAIQSKVYCYLDYVEGGQLITDYPDAEGARLVIELVCKHDMSELGSQLIEQLDIYAKAQTNAKVRYRVGR